MSGKISKEPLTTFLHHKRGLKDRGVELVVEGYFLRLDPSTIPADFEVGRSPTWFTAEAAKRALAEDRAPAYALAYARALDEAVAKLA